MNDPKLVPCRCGREAEELLDGSLYGCSECFVSASSPTEWNALVGKEQDDYSAEFAAFCEAEGYSGDVFKANLWKVWRASRLAIEVKLPGIYADCYCPSTAQAYKEDCASVLNAIGLTVKE